MSCFGDSAGCMIAENLTLNEHYYWLEEQLSAEHFGADSNYSRCATSVADGAHLLTDGLEWLEALKILWPLSWVTKVSGVSASSNRSMLSGLIFLTLCFSTFDPCPWIMASSAAVSKNLSFFHFWQGASSCTTGFTWRSPCRTARKPPACSFLQVGSFWTACKNGQDTYDIFLAFTCLGALPAHSAKQAFRGHLELDPSAKAHFGKEW